MPKLALNFICKDEAHVIENMLESVKSITDLIVCNDTGSTDGTQEIIKKFGEKAGIPTFVFERQFDNFENSRNHAMVKLREVATELGWNLSDTWGYWIDCDEVMSINPKFNKSQFNKDLYMINTYIRSMKYTRNTFFRLNKDFEWWGPVHEYIISKSKDITSGLVEGLHVIVNMTGASWQGEVHEKYRTHSVLLEDYIINKDRNPRWIFYTAQSFHDSSNVPNNKPESEERLRRALKYYRERVNRTDGYEEERFYSQYRIGTIMRALEMPWKDSMQELLKAYAMDPLRAESIKTIIDYYLSVGEYNLAYIYSKFSKVNFHGKNPYPKKLLFVDEALYVWKILEVHAAACFYTGRKEESKANFEEIISLTKTQPNLFTEEDLQKINANKAFFL